ncbi:unnamed protein product [Symbiodinium sp. CCMP2592]|nr:unnamed protein product [Symbiodinium sp. CCMP2592]
MRPCGTSNFAKVLAVLIATLAVRQLPGLTAWVCCRPGTRSHSHGERTSRVRCGAEESNSWLPQFENPLAGSMADPGYWKQQYYLASELKQFLPPNRKTITAMQLAPEDIKYVGYLAPDKEKSPNKLTEYVILGPVSDVLKYEFKNQCEVYAVNPSFRQWQKDVDKVIPRKDVHIAVVAAGTAKRLGKKILIQGLAQVSAALTAEGRALLVCDAQDEEVLGGKMEELLEAQEWKDLEKTGDLPPDPEKTAALEVLQQGRLRLMRVFRDECGLAVGLCVEEKKPAQARKKRARPVRGGPRERAVARSSRSGRRS